MYRVRYAQGQGLSFDPALVHTGGTQDNGGNNSGYQALNLAVLLGAGRLVLLGYDMGGDRTHWHGDHPLGLNNPKPVQLARYAEGYASTVPDLERAGIGIVNCSRETALECFPRARIEDVL